MIGRLLCWLGFHRWIPRRAILLRQPGKRDTVVTISRCTRCGAQDPLPLRP